MPVVQLLHTCLINEFAPHVGLAAARVLERLGYEVQVPLDQTCCGQPAFNAGFPDEARRAGRHTIGLLDATEGPIVIPSGSCGDMVIHQYRALFDREPEWRARADAVASRCREFSAFVFEHLNVLPPASLDASVTYHPSCHLLRGLQIDRQPRALLAAIDGLDVRALPSEDDCCGFGGLFSIKHPDISGRMLDRKLASVAATGADRLVCCDMGCLVHLAGGLHRRRSPVTPQHLAELLDEAWP